MRTHPSHPRARSLVTDESVPRRADGGLALCHHCQRAIYFAGGFIELLIKDVRLLAVHARQS